MTFKGSFQTTVISYGSMVYLNNIGNIFLNISSSYSPLVIAKIIIILGGIALYHEKIN